jgi:Fe-S cluster assembly ATP-binding protein
VEEATVDNGLGVLAITHYSRLFHELRPDFVHILMGGRIVASRGPELADELERNGYAAFAPEEIAEDGGDGDTLDDLFAMP